MHDVVQGMHSESTYGPLSVSLCVFISLIFHLFDVLSSAILYLGVGLGAAAVAGAVLLSGLAELFYHWNVRTPHWLGYLFQRPESHCVHHQEGVHSYNFADLPLWDILFGTFHNPRVAQFRCGFGPGHEHRLAEMLWGVDVNRTPSERSL